VVTWCDGIVGAGWAFFEEAVAAGHEGVVAKRLSAHYRPGKRESAWRKIKQVIDLPCVVIGYRIIAGELRSLLMATLRDGEPCYAGAVESYRILKPLGAGGMGVVFEAEDTTLRRRVALKVMKPELAASPASRERFLREAQAAARVRHDHIVTIYQAGEGGGVVFLAMEYLHGETLDTLCQRQGPFRFAEPPSPRRPARLAWSFPCRLRARRRNRKGSGRQ